jgi:hypothetical protein
VEKVKGSERAGAGELASDEEAGEERVGGRGFCGLKTNKIEVK